MRKYETPKLKIVHYDINEKIMDGYKDGDIGTFPWGDLFTDPSSDNDASGLSLNF